MIKRSLTEFLSGRRCTLLGVGPMSKNCVDATIELANDHEVPLMLIASRRQIECEAMGGGYVNGWSTESFAKYVIDKDKKGKVILARDHGGPWQADFEKQQEMSLRHAMASAKESFRMDIECGFEVIHVDPSIDIHGTLSLEGALQRLYDLYEYCWTVARQNQRNILLEIGTEEQSGNANSQEQLEYVLNEVASFCHKNRLPRPTFVVVQTGTKVMETRNVGSFDSPVRIADELPVEIQLLRMIQICNRSGVLVKQHNTDYLSDEALSWHPKLGIHSANVAPEFGVAETRALLQLLGEYHLSDLEERFLTLAYDSGRWKKWMLADSSATDRDRAVIAGHYVFGEPAFAEIKRDAQARLPELSVDGFLKEEVKKEILRYMRLFSLLGGKSVSINHSETLNFCTRGRDSLRSGHPS